MTSRTLSKICLSNNRILDKKNYSQSCWTTKDIITLTHETIPNEFSQIILMTKGYPIQTHTEKVWTTTSIILHDDNSALFVEILDVSLHADDTILYCNTAGVMTLKLGNQTNQSHTDCESKSKGDSWKTWNSFIIDINMSRSKKRGRLFRKTSE